MKAGLVSDSSNLYQHIFYSPDEVMQEGRTPGSWVALGVWTRISTAIREAEYSATGLERVSFQKSQAPLEDTFGICNTLLFQYIILGGVSSFST